MATSVYLRRMEQMADTVIVMCEPSGGDAVRVDVATLSEVLSTIDPSVETLVFHTADEVADESEVADLGEAVDGVIRSLVDRLSAEPDHVAAIRRVPAVNATKRVHDGVVVEAVDRETLNLLRPPEAVDRRALDAALARLDASGPPTVNPTMLAAADGGKVLIVDAETG